MVIEVDSKTNKMILRTLNEKGEMIEAIESNP